MTNIEIKARFRKTSRIDETLKKIGARFEIRERQTDTYFRVNQGRLKLREREPGTTQLVQYFREDRGHPRPSNYEIVEVDHVDEVKARLIREHGIRAVVIKNREVWLWKNVRIHFDRVEKLGEFLEFEAVVEEEKQIESDRKHVAWLMDEFGIRKEDVIPESYVDLIERNQNESQPLE